ncbi:hypothetical protein ACSBR2_012485 [Camellia fascicularis]
MLIQRVLELELRDGHIKQLQKTPFWVMIDAIRVNELDSKLFKKFDATVCRIIQTYNLEDEKFHIGGAKLPLPNNDIRLIFGVQCGKEKLDLTHGGKRPSDFMQRCCANVSRISSKVIKDLLSEAICGRTERDEEDVAKLVCFYICAKLFFATTGEHIGWAFVRVIDKLDTLKQYDWTATIRNTLIGLLNETHNRLERVTSCVVVLLFLICEHSSIITSERPNNIGAIVGKLKGINLSAKGCIKVRNEKLQCGKLVGTIIECHILKLAAVVNEPRQDGRITMDVDPANACDGRGAVAEMNDVGSVEPSFNCWQLDTLNGGPIKMEGVDDHGNNNSGTPTSKEKVAGKACVGRDVWPVLFPDLLDLSSTPDGEAIGTEPTGVNDELRTAKVRITELESEMKNKNAQVCELEHRVETLETLLGKHAGNLFIDFNSVIVKKDTEIAQLKTLDSLDDREVHEVTQCVANDGSNLRTTSNIRSGKVSGFGNVMSGESRTEDVGIPALEIVEDEAGVEDLTVDFADVYVRLIVSGVEGSYSRRNTQSVSSGNVNVGAAVVGIQAGWEDIIAATSTGPKMTSLVKRVKNKPRWEFRLFDYEYPDIFEQQKVSDNVRLSKSFEPGVIYSVEDVEVERKT